MSSITDVIMIDSGELLITEDNTFSYKMCLVEDYVTQHWTKNQRDEGSNVVKGFNYLNPYFGGYKVTCSEILAGSFNYFDLDGFLNKLNELFDCTTLQIAVKHEEDEAYTIYQHKDNKWCPLKSQLTSVLLVGGYTSTKGYHSFTIAFDNLNLAYKFNELLKTQSLFDLKTEVNFIKQCGGESIFDDMLQTIKLMGD